MEKQISSSSSAVAVARRPPIALANVCSWCLHSIIYCHVMPRNFHSSCGISASYKMSERMKDVNIFRFLLAAVVKVALQAF